MKLNCKRIDFTYTPGEEIFTFPDESGLPFLFDVEKELTADPTAMDAVGEMLDEAEKLAEKAKAAIKAALADEDSRYHSVVTFFMEFHRDDVGPDKRNEWEEIKAGLDKIGYARNCSGPEPKTPRPIRNMNPSSPRC